MIHRNQELNFRNSEFPMSGGFLHQLIKPRFLEMNVGELYEYLADILWATNGVMTNRVDFTLVNVFSPVTHFSHGSEEAPPLVTGAAPVLVFTFALSRRTYTGRRVLERNVRHRSNQIFAWGFDSHAKDFISITVSAVQADEWGMLSPRAYELQYLYNMIGPLTKSFLRRQAEYKTRGFEYEEIHSAISLRDRYSALYRLPLKRLFTSVPFHLWVFNYHIWEHAPNLLSERLITPSAAVYYFMHLAGACQHEGYAVVDERIGYGGDSGVGGQLAASIVQLVQDIRTPNMSDTDESTARERLAPALIESFSRSRQARVEMSDTGQAFEQTQAAQREGLIDDLKGSNEIGNLLLPANEVAARILRADKNWRQTFNRALGRSGK